MKRFTRMLSATLALATVCAASLIPASAASRGFYGNTNPTDSNGKANKVDELPITATYGLPKNGLLPQARFIYTLSPVTVDANTLASTDAEGSDDVFVSSGSELFADGLTATWEVPSQYVEQTQTTSRTLSAKDVSIDFSSLPKNAETGVYRFTLTQTVYEDEKDEETGLKYYKVNSQGTYDKTEYRVDLYVQGAVAATADKAGTDAYIYLVKVYEEVDVKNAAGEKTGTKWVKAEPAFANSIAVEDLEIRNYVDDNVTGLDIPFTIALQILEGSDVDDGVTLKAGTDLNAYVVTASGHQIPCNGEVDELTNRKYDPIVVNEDGKWNTFELYNGEYLVVPGVPVGMQYTTYNTDTEDIAGFVNTYGTVIGLDSDGKDTLTWPVDFSDFVSAVTKDKNGAEIPEENTEVIAVGQNKIIYYNVNQDISNTGITMDTAPYIVMFVAAAGLAVLSLAKKKINR
jgi:hypothetical protein